MTPSSPPSTDAHAPRPARTGAADPIGLSEPHRALAVDDLVAALGTEARF